MSSYSVVDRPLAAPGLISYRYKSSPWGSGGMHGWVMIGARDNADALREAKRSTSGPATLANLQVWNKSTGKYEPVRAKRRR